MAIHLHYRSPDFPYSTDSASYIEQARNLVNSGSLLSTPYGILPSNLDQIENKLFPIGFSVVLAALSTFGFDAKDVAIEISHWSAILLPWLIYFCFRAALGSRGALVIACLICISPSVLLNSPMGLTDMFALALAIGAISLTLNARSTLVFIFSGILAGMAYTVRNAHLALLISIGLYYFYLWFSDNTKDRPTLYKHLAGQFFGISIIVFPILMRNIYLFGKPNPYQMAPSTIGFIENLRTYIDALIKDLTACNGFANYIAWSIPGLVGLILVVSCLCWLFSKYTWYNLEAAGRKLIVLSTIYAVVGSCVVIVARTRYQWGEVISIRHTLQYTPFFLTIILAPVLGYSTGRFSKFLRVFKVALVVSLVLFHINYALFSEAFQNRNNNNPTLLNAYEIGENHLCAKENNVFLVSNWAYVFRIKCAARVRQIEPINIAYNKDMQALIAGNEGYNNLIAAIDDVKHHAMGRPIHIGFFPGSFGLEARNFPLQSANQQKLLDSGWAIIRNDEHGLLIKYEKNML
ncbi:MAG: hypothetical protein F2903_10080 [Actinobacteria bacterium]|nr:hypothetical protein [Actinomycetota bacterium]